MHTVIVGLTYDCVSTIMHEMMHEMMHVMMHVMIMMLKIMLCKYYVALSYNGNPY